MLQAILRRFRRRTWQDEDGISLAEMLVAVFLLGVALSALAGVIMTSIRAVSRNEREVTATALSVEVLEELQTLRWDNVALYENEIADTSTLDGITRWRSRLASDDTYQGHEIVTEPAYSGTTSPTNPYRDERLPLPTSQLTRSGVTYDVDRYLTWIDADSDGLPDTKRFSVAVSWDDVDGDRREVVTEAERVPTQDESSTTSAGIRVIYFSISPDPAELDRDTARHLLPLTITVWTNAGVLDGKLTVKALHDTDDGTAITQTLSMTASDPAGSGWARWDRSIPAETYRFWNGQVDMHFAATTATGDPVTGVGTMTTFVGPVDQEPGAPEPVESETVSPSPSPSPTDSPPPYEVAFIGAPIVDEVCVSAGSWKLKQDVTITIQVQGLSDADNEVSVTYTYFSRKTNDADAPPDTVATDLAVRQDGSSASSATYKLTIPSGSRLFRPGDTVTFRFDARRQRDGQNVVTEVDKVVVTTC